MPRQTLDKAIEIAQGMDAAPNKINSSKEANVYKYVCISALHMHRFTYNREDAVVGQITIKAHVGSKPLATCHKCGKDFYIIL